MDNNDDLESDWVFPNKSSGDNSTIAGPGLVWSPSVEIRSKGDDLVVTMGLPEIDPEDIEVQAEGNQLIVRGEYHSKEDRKDEENKVRYAGRSLGSFYRNLSLPAGINAGIARTRFSGGVLHVIIPNAARDAVTSSKGKLSEESIQSKPVNITTGNVSS